MNRTKLHALNPETARKRIKAATSTKAFMTALMERDHRRHAEAVRQWTRLHEVAHPEETNGGKRDIKHRHTAGRPDEPSTTKPGRSQGRFQIADSGVDDWLTDRAQEAAEPRDAAQAVDGPSKPLDDRPSLPGSSGSPSGVWVVDRDRRSTRDFVLVNPITDQPMTDENGARIAAPPEAFDSAVPPAVLPYQNALLSIWHIDEIPDDVSVGVRSGIVYGIMLDMLQVRSMTNDEQRDLFRRIAELPERFGRDWTVVSGHLRGRLRRAIAEPFWYPAIMTDEELEAHRSMARTVETIGEFGRMAAGGGAGVAAGVPGGAGRIGRGGPFAVAGFAADAIDEHYESRAEAYEAEQERRRFPNVWPPAP